MGFLQLIPATKLAAMYDTVQRKLILFAEGDAIQFTSGINFKRNPAFVGGLEFSLMGWVGPLSGKKQPYQYKQAFAISLPTPHFESGSVIIITANHPKGQKVPIRFTGLPPAKSGTKKATAADKDETVADTVPGHTQLNVLFRTQFTIKAGSRVPTAGSVDISFDKKYVQLVDATIEDGDIVWTFLAAEMGNTQILVTTYGGIATFIARKVYDVRIFVL
jgi:hypothetical protein